MDCHIKVILKIVLLVMSFTAQADLSNRKDLFKNEIFFTRSFVINPEVENWTNVFFKKFFEKESLDIEIRFSEDTDISYGFIEGEFSSWLASSGFISIAGDFVFYVDPNDGKESEYGFHFETELEIENTEAFFQFVKKEFSFCERATLVLSFCNIFKIENPNPESNRLDQITRNLYDWKENFIADLYTIEHPEVLAIKDRFVDGIAGQISITELSESVILEIDLSGLKSEFEEEAKSFFRETKLTDYSLEKLRVEFFENQIFMALHFSKLHVAKVSKLYVELLSHLQKMIEDEERGIGLAESLRTALSDKKISGRELLKHIKKKEIWDVGWEVGKSLILGDEEDNSLVDKAVEEELGLD